MQPAGTRNSEPRRLIAAGLIYQTSKHGGVLDEQTIL